MRINCYSFDCVLLYQTKQKKRQFFFFHVETVFSKKPDKHYKWLCENKIAVFIKFHMKKNVNLKKEMKIVFKIDKLYF
jgi:hypothetical protein